MSNDPDEIADSTRIIGKRPGRRDDSEPPTRSANRPDRTIGAPPAQSEWRSAPTEIMGRTSGGPPPKRTESTATQVIGRSPNRNPEHTKVITPEELHAEIQGAADAMTDPVVGWLVIVDGPGRGNFIPVGYGQNTIGRDESERVRIDYGDNQISRQSHCFIVYESNERAFYVLRGTGKGLCHVNQRVVLEPRQIHSGELLRVGATTLRFMAFCGPEYDWQDGPLTSPKANPPAPAADPAAEA